MAYGCHAVFWWVAILTVAAEMAPAVKNLLAGLTGHHWVTKSLTAIILFSIVALVFSSREDPKDATGMVKGVIFSALAAAGLIFVFYTLHFRGIV